MDEIARTCGKPAAIDTYEEVAPAEAYAEFPGLEGHVDDYPEVEHVRVYRGSVAESSINWTSESGQNLVIVVDGDLWSDGVVDLSADQDKDEDFTLYVTGSVSARDICVYLDARLVVLKDLEAERAVMCGGANLANITVTGELRAALVLEFADGQIKAGAGTPAAWADRQDNVDIPGARWIEPALLPDLLDEGEPDQRKLRRAAIAGSPIFS